MIPASVSKQLLTCPHCGLEGFSILGLAVHPCPVKQMADAQRSTPPPLAAEPVITRSVLTRWLDTGRLPPPPTATTFYLQPRATSVSPSSQQP